MAGLEHAGMEIQRRSLLQAVARVTPGHDQHGACLRDVDDRVMLPGEGAPEIPAQCCLAAGFANDQPFIRPEPECRHATARANSVGRRGQIEAQNLRDCRAERWIARIAPQRDLAAKCIFAQPNPGIGMGFGGPGNQALVRKRASPLIRLNHRCAFPRFPPRCGDQTTIPACFDHGTRCPHGAPARPRCGRRVEVSGSPAILQGSRCCVPCDHLAFLATKARTPPAAITTPRTSPGCSAAHARSPV